MTEPYFRDDAVTLYAGDCLRDGILARLPDASVDAVVCDPPYGLDFMGKAWDRFTAREFEDWCAEWAAECLRVLKPGGHLLAFGGTRTYHRLTAGIEDAGFEIRDSITWMYASGFPKSLDVSKAIDKAAGAEREVVGISARHGGGVRGAGSSYELDPVVPLLTAPATDAARTWQGWGTALKPASEPIVVARKPLTGTVAQTVVTHGTGALNIDGCRVAGDVEPRATPPLARASTEDWRMKPGLGTTRPEGRWPSNVVLSHAPDCRDVGEPWDDCVDGCPVRELDRQSGVTTSNDPGTTHVQARGWGHSAERRNTGYAGDSGGASRFFPVFRYEPKAPTAERPRVQREDGTWEAHATVKPLDLMRWLVRLVTPPGGTVLDHFAGSGTTGEACVLEGFRCILVEREPDYLPLIVARLTKPLQPGLFGGVA